MLAWTCPNLEQLRRTVPTPELPRGPSEAFVTVLQPYGQCSITTAFMVRLHILLAVFSAIAGYQEVWERSFQAGSTASEEPQMVASYNCLLGLVQGEKCTKIKDHLDWISLSWIENIKCFPFHHRPPTVICQVLLELFLEFLKLTSSLLSHCHCATCTLSLAYSSN